MFKEIVSLFTTNPVVSVIISVVLTLLIWIYKENRKSIVDEKKLKISSLAKRLEIYCTLESSLALYLTNPNDANLTKQLYDCLGKSKPLLSDELKIIVSDFYKDKDLSKILLILSILHSEMKKLFDVHKKEVTNLNPEDPMEFIQELVKPFRVILLILLLSAIFLVTLQLVQHSLLLSDKIIVIFYAVSCTISLLLIYLIYFLVFIEKSILNKDRVFWAIMISIILIPTLFLFINYYSIILQTIFVIGLFWYDKRKKRRGIFTF